MILLSDLKNSVELASKSSHLNSFASGPLGNPLMMMMVTRLMMIMKSADDDDDDEVDYDYEIRW